MILVVLMCFSRGIMKIYNPLFGKDCRIKGSVWTERAFTEKQFTVFIMFYLTLIKTIFPHSPGYMSRQWNHRLDAFDARVWCQGSVCLVHVNYWCKCRKGESLSRPNSDLISKTVNREKCHERQITCWILLPPENGMITQSFFDYK